MRPPGSFRFLPGARRSPSLPAKFRSAQAPTSHGNPQVLASATPTNPPPAVVAPVPVAAPTAFSWTGVYVGGDFGGSFASTSIASATTGWASRSLNPAGVMGGAYAGYNYQVSPNFVVGLEGDFQGNSQLG